MKVGAIDEGQVLPEGACRSSKDGVEVEHIGKVDQNRGDRVYLLLLLVLA